MTAKKILVVDDNEHIVELLRIMVEEVCDMEAVTASNMGAVETKSVDALNCSLAILDINLGENEPSGIDVYKWLLENDFKSPTYFLTGHARSDPRVIEAARMGKAKILSKPIDSGRLIEIMREINEQ